MRSITWRAVRRLACVSWAAAGARSNAPSNRAANGVLITLLIVSEVQLYLVDETPAPVLSRLKRAHDGVIGLVEVLGGVFVPGRIATAHVTANEAQPQVDPAIAHLEAFFATVRMR